MASVVIAMSFDWSLFLLSRWREELDTRRLPRKGAPDAIFYRPAPVSSETNEEAVAISLRYAGQTVATSGTVLFACFISMTVLPLMFVQTFGLAAAISLLYTIVANLTLTPSLLLIFRRFFSLDGFIPGIDFAALLHTKRCGGGEEGGKPRFSVFRWLGSRMARVPYGFLATLLVLAIGLVFAYFAQGIKTTKNLTQMLPYRSEALHVMRRMATTAFAPGISEPYELIVVPKPDAPVDINGSYVWTEEFFDETYACVVDLGSKVDGLSTANIAGIVTALGDRVTFEFAKMLTDPKSGWYTSDLGIAYRQMLKYMVNEWQNSSFLVLFTSFSPMDNVTEFLEVTRAVIDNCTARNGSHYRFLLTGDLVSMEDAVSKVLALFPIMAGSTFAIVAVFLLAVYRTAMLPVRALLTIAVTLSSAFGAGTLVFVSGWFDNLSNVIAENNKAFFWFSPICIFVVVLGLSLDYDLFCASFHLSFCSHLKSKNKRIFAVFTRIFENRSKGLSTKESVSMAVAHSGKIIFFAGLIMAIAFGGLIASNIVVCIFLSWFTYYGLSLITPPIFFSKQAIAQMGFCLCFGVLFDTLFVHTLLVPSVVSMLREMNWWPRRFHLRSRGNVDDERTSLLIHQGQVNYTGTPTSDSSHQQ